MIDLIKKPTIVGVFFTIIFFVSSCEEKESIVKEAQINSISEPVINLNRYESLLIVNNEDSNKFNTNLYGITEDDKLEEIVFSLKDNKEDTIPEFKIEANKLWNVNDDYIYIDGYFEAWNTKSREVTFQSILVNKNTGKIHDMSEHPVIPENVLSGDRVFQGDGNGAVYFKSESSEVPKTVKKIEFDGESISVRLVKSGDHHVYYLQIDQDGNSFICSNRNKKVGEEFTKEYKIITSKGETIDFEIDNKLIQRTWIGSDHSFYIFSTPRKSDSSKIYNISKVVVEEGEIKRNVVWEKDYWSLSEEIRLMGTSYFRMVRSDGEVFFLGNGLIHSSFTTPILSFDEQTHNLSDDNKLYAEISRDAKVKYNSDFYFVNDINRLMKVDFSTNNIEDLLPNDAYTIDEFSISKNNVVFLLAKRNADNKNVVLKIKSGNVVSIVENMSFSNILSLNEFLF